MVSSVHGRIKTLFFVLPKGLQGIKHYDIYTVFRELVESMKTVEKFIVVHHENEFSEKWGLKLKQDYPNRIHSFRIRPGKKLDIWIQDKFYPINYSTETEQHIYLASGELVDSNTKRRIQELIDNMNKIQENELKLLHCPLPFDGGDILVGDNFVLVGEDSRYNNIGQQYSTEEYKKWFGYSPLFIKSKISPMNSFTSSDGFVNKFPKTRQYKQPLLHIDMFISLAGYNKEKEYILVVGEPLFEPELPYNIPDDLFNCIYNWLAEIKKAIESIIVMLKFEKFKIIRAPLVLTYEDDVIKNNSIQKVRHWFWASYNNCLVEIIDAKDGQLASKKVWIPSYGGTAADYSNRYMKPKNKEKIAEAIDLSSAQITYGDWSSLSKYDEWNERIWKALGFETCLLKKNYIPFALRMGSLNCITNCIEREQ